MLHHNNSYKGLKQDNSLSRFSPPDAISKDDNGPVRPRPKKLTTGGSEEEKTMEYDPTNDDLEEFLNNGVKSGPR